MEEPMQRRPLLRQPNLASAVILPDELMVEIISWLPVKHVMKLRCVNKFFDTLIFDPHFVQLHLNKSKQNSHMALTYLHLNNNLRSSLVTHYVPSVLQNQSTIFHHSDLYYLLNDKLHKWWQQQRVVGSCNGLLCLAGVSYSYANSFNDHWLCFWNPAMRTKSKKIRYRNNHFKLSFGYDNLTRTYRVVAFYVEEKPGCNLKCVVKIFTLGDNSWRDIHCLPLVPLYWLGYNDINNGVHLNGTINWLALHDYINSSVTAVDQYVILSLDLSTETYTQLLLPAQRFDNSSVTQYVLSHPLKLVVLMNCLCFCHNIERTHFVIWQMKNFGVQESWIQLFKISSENFLPLYLSKNGDTLILAKDKDKAFIYNRRDNLVEKLEISNSTILWSQAMDYVESLVLSE